MLVEARYGFWQGCWDQAVARYLDCGAWECGSARVRCGECRYEMLVAFSCKQRELCPSCAAKRGSELAAFITKRTCHRLSAAKIARVATSNAWRPRRRRQASFDERGRPGGHPFQGRPA